MDNNEIFVKKYLPSTELEQFESYLKKKITPLERINDLIIEAIKLNASDVHIEPITIEEGDEQKKLLVCVRIRILGELREISNFTNSMSKYILMGDDFEKYLKGVKLKLGVGHSDGTQPLDAQGEISQGNIQVKLRYSFLPQNIPLQGGVGNFSKIVIRILDKQKNIIKLDNLPLLESDLNKIKNFNKKTQGFFIMAGPTGSGKTTTLYSIIGELNSISKNIQTLEDPVEYEIPGINQSKINDKGDNPYTFAKGLRAILRQDPDIIMIGEIRDTETGDIAILAAQTGHLVLSTIHTNSSIDIYKRLIDMGIDPYKVINAMNIGMSQRLLKQVCPVCNKERSLNENELNDFQILFSNFNFDKLTLKDLQYLFLGTLPEGKGLAIIQAFKENNEKLRLINYELISKRNDKSLLEEKNKLLNNNLRLNRVIFNNLWKKIINLKVKDSIFGNKDCPHCKGEGYSGRIPIFEIVENTDALSDLLLTKPTKKELAKYVEDESIFTLKRYSFLRLMHGKIDMLEYEKITI